MRPAIKWRYPFFDTVAFIDTDGKQQLKLVTSENPSNLIDVGQRAYFKTIAKGGGWTANDFCNASPCALESVWSRTTGEAQSVLAKKTDLKLRMGSEDRNLAVAAISFPMRSLIGPVLPPGFAFAVIDDTGDVLFHSDRQRNGNENFFVETDNNRRLRAQVAAHSADALNINYWGAQYRAYVKPMQLPGMYVVAMAQAERAWAINREWLVVTLTLLAAYLLLWLVLALFTLAPGASWVWPDPRRRERYRVVSIVCVVLLGIAVGTARYGTPAHLVSSGVVLPLVGWGLAFLLYETPVRASERRRAGHVSRVFSGLGSRTACDRRDPWLDALSRVVPVARVELYQEQSAHRRTPACGAVRPGERSISGRCEQPQAAGGVVHEHRVRP